MNILKKILIAITFILIIYAPSVHAEKTIDIYFFYGEGCPHCADEELALERLKEKHSNLVVHYYETWYNRTNQKLLEDVADMLNVSVQGIPFTIIGEKQYTGFDKNNTENLLDSRIEYYTNNDYNNQVGDFIAGRPVQPVETDSFNKDDKKEIVIPEETPTINVPFIGEVEFKDLSLPLIAVVIGAIDGFNPCAMWILLFLISMLIGMENKKRMWAIGLTFLITSAIIYMLFMLAWLNFTSVIGTVVWLRLLIAIIAIVGGVINLRSYMKARKVDGCDVVDDNKRKKLFDNIRHITHEKTLLLALFGTMALAISVNIVELACSSGLPVVFIGILMENGLASSEYFMYVLLYIFVFLLDDIIVFAIAMFTMEVTGISTKYGKLSHLFGGIIMLIIGILMILKPEWLMFNF